MSSNRSGVLNILNKYTDIIEFIDQDPIEELTKLLIKLVNS